MLRIHPAFRRLTVPVVLLLAVFEPSSGIESDDFNTGVLDTRRWWFVDPLGDGMAEVNDTRAIITVPADRAHDVWKSGNSAPRLMQSAQDTDFEIEVKFESPVSKRYQLQGLLAQQDESNFVRVDFYSDGFSVRAFAAVFVHGTPTVMANIRLSGAAGALYMRLRRRGDVWTQSWGEDGQSWETVATFSHSLTVTAVGVFAGNAGSSAPAHGAVVDYFFNTAAPIVPEDGRVLHTLTLDVTGSGDVTVEPLQAGYATGEVVELTAAPAPGWVFDGWMGDIVGFENPLSITMNADMVLSAGFVAGAVAEYVLEVTTVGLGRVTLDPPGGVYAEGTTVTLTAVGEPGWELSGWSGAVAGSANPATITMTGDQAVTATFDTDITPPVISSVKVAPGRSSATVSWETDEPTTGKVSWGETTFYETGIEHTTALLQHHAMTLSGLAAGVTYHLRIFATDNAGNETLSPDVAFTTTANPSGIESDDFSGSDLDTQRWSFVDPLGDGVLAVNDSQVTITVPAGRAHDVWKSGNFAPRIMQAAADTNFEIEAKFESTVARRYQLQGLLALDDEANFVRVDFYSDGSSVRAFAAVFVDGDPTVKANTRLSVSEGPLYLRLRRRGDVWTQSCSEDGLSWEPVATFSHPLTVTGVGVFAGNAGSSAPEHRAVVDYFFNTAAPVSPEDGHVLHTLTVDVTGSGGVTRNPDRESYPAGTVVELTATPSTGWTFDGWTGDTAGFDNPLSVTMNGDVDVAASFVAGAAVEYVLNGTTVGAGRVTMDPPGGVYNEGTTVTLTAVAEPGWEFGGWSGAPADSGNPTTVVMTRDYAVTAVFDTDVTPPAIRAVTVTPGNGSATVSWETDEPATGAIAYGTTERYELGLQENAMYSLTDTFRLTGLTENTTYHFRVIAVDRAGLESVSDDFHFTLADGPIIDVWYGSHQTFGSTGVTQRWVNILGNAADPDGLRSLSYRINGGPDRPLSIGPFRRLEEPGDFNVEIDFADLVDGANQVDIAAVDGIGNVSVRTVFASYLSGNVWPAAHTINWSSVDRPREVVQIIDGKWEVAGNRLRPAALGYDRGVALGDIAWTDYEVLIPLTIHDIDPQGFSGINFAPAVGVMLKWPGYTNWTGDQQPSWGYYPGGGGAWYEFDEDGTGALCLTDFRSFTRRDPLGRSLRMDREYYFRVRVETESDGSCRYSMRAWEAGRSEPSTWELVAFDETDVESGCLLLLAHYVDVSFGNISIRPIATDVR